jgi:hypothetical protein
MAHSGGNSEGGRQYKNLCAMISQHMEELGKAQIVADGQPELDAFAVAHDYLVTSHDHLGLKILKAVRQHHVEEVQLAIAGCLHPGTVEDNTRIVDVLATPLGQTTTVQPHAVFSGSLCGPTTAGPRDGLGRIYVVAVIPMEVEHLGQHHQIRPLLREMVNSFTGRRQIVALVLT